MKTRGRERLMKKGSVMCVLCVLVATQLVGCGWYMKPGKGGAGQFAGGPIADSSWGTNTGGGTSGGGQYGATPGAGADSWGPGAGADAARTRLSGEPVAMLNTVYFDYDRANLRPDQLRTLESNLAWIQQNPGSRVRLEGHCDERGTEEYNLALGDNRADAVRDWLTAQGVNPSGVGGISKGELEPADLGHDESAWSKNRRVEFLILE